MNFIDYLIKTKNYSALSAVNEYTKQFAFRTSAIRDRINRGYTGVGKKVEE